MKWIIIMTLGSLILGCHQAKKTPQVLPAVGETTSTNPTSRSEVMSVEQNIALLKLQIREMELTEINKNWELKLKQHFDKKSKSDYFIRYKLLKGQDFTEMFRLMETNKLTPQAGMNLHIKYQKIFAEYIGHEEYKEYLKLFVEENQAIRAKGFQEKLFF
jgi:hypothetical protein